MLPAPFRGVPGECPTTWNIPGFRWSGLLPRFLVAIRFRVWNEQERVKKEGRRKTRHSSDWKTSTVSATTLTCSACWFFAEAFPFMAFAASITAPIMTVLPLPTSPSPSPSSNAFFLAACSSRLTASYRHLAMSRRPPTLPCASITWLVVGERHVAKAFGG